MSVKNLIAIAPLSMLVACGWVDSTGRESNSAPVTQISFDDGQQTQSSALNELAAIKLVVNGTDADGVINSFEWKKEPVEQGALAQCSDVADFDMSIAADSLAEACSSDALCQVSIDQADPSAEADEFLVSAPKLKAPVGVTYELVATDNEGGTGTQRSTFCLIAINEAPDANDDMFTVLEGETLTVTADQVNLLSNDTAHEHVSNSQLQVLSNPIEEPQLASEFTLDTDGGFSYSASRLADSTVDQRDDTFVYAVTDGSNDPAIATVTVQVLSKNDAPVQLASVPVQQVVAGVPFDSDLSEFFNDPEGVELTFAIVSGSLPPSGELVLTSAGLLTGTASPVDVGNYPIRIIASDGSERITAELSIVVSDNLPVDAVSILAQAVAVGDVFTIDVSESFDDPENGPLQYSVDTRYSSATLSMDATTGVLTGTFTDAGSYPIDVSANDGVTQPTSIRFVVVVSTNNVAPIFRGNVLSQSVNLGSAITPISGAFSDANNDVLNYSVAGILPDGLTLSAAGVLSGIPTESGLFTNIRIIARDPFDEFARSNAFSIQVIDTVVPPANSAPVYVEGTVFNQGILSGAPVTPVRPTFTDADNDLLRYTVIGATLPLGVVLNSVTGVVSGTALRVEWVTNLRIVATDPSGASATSDEFWIRVR